MHPLSVAWWTTSCSLQQFEQNHIAHELLGVVDMQPTWMHIKDHIQETKFLPMYNECHLTLAIIHHPI
jgi:hypothetical protein